MKKIWLDLFFALYSYSGGQINWNAEIWHSHCFMFWLIPYLSDVLAIKFGCLRNEETYAVLTVCVESGSGYQAFSSVDKHPKKAVAWEPSAPTPRPITSLILIFARIYAYRWNRLSLLVTQTLEFNCQPVWELSNKPKREAMAMTNLSVPINLSTTVEKIGVFCIFVLLHGIVVWSWRLGSAGV